MAVTSMPVASPKQAEIAGGLTQGEAARRLAAGENNVQPVQTGRTYGAILRENVFTFINNVLFGLGAALIAVGEVTDAVVAVGVVLANIVTSVIQEVRAKRSLDRIALLTRPHATVVRDGQELAVDPGEVVRGDLLIARPGDQIVVDGPIAGGAGIQMDESLLSGESDLVRKQAGDMLLSGSFCVTGEAQYRAERIGEESFVNGLTATARKYRRSLTPLQREVNVIIRVILLVAALLELLFLVSLPIHQVSVADGVKMSVVIAKLVPAGLLLSITLAYALGALRIVRRGALVQQVNAVESISNVDVLCLDKTGTLTANRLALEDVMPIGVSNTALRQVLGELAASTVGGNRTISALRQACPAKSRQVLDEVPFSSEWKWSALALAGEAGTETYVLGAPDVLTEVVRIPDVALSAVSEWSAQGRRVLLCVQFPGSPSLHDGGGKPRLPAGGSPLGLLALRDELRPHARETLDRFGTAGVQPKIISGDSPETVSALAAQAGLGTGLVAVSGPDLAEMDTVQRAIAVREATIFGRVVPAQKRELIELLQQQGHYVAMIGDGVNDVLSLKRANVAVAMESGSQAARAVADIVLLGDSFETLPEAVEEGQRIQNGLRNIIKLFLTRVLAVAMLLIGVALLGGFAFDPKHISVLTTLTVGIPTIGLAAWARPGPVRRGSVTRQALHFVLPAAITLALAGVAVYLFVELTASLTAVTRAQTALTIMAVPCGLLLVPFVAPPTHRWAGGNAYSGDWRPTILAGALFASFLLLLGIRPLRTFFGLVSLTGKEYLVIGGIVLVWAVVLRFIWRYRVLDRFLGIDLQPPVDTG